MADDPVKRSRDGTRRDSAAGAATTVSTEPHRKLSIGQLAALTSVSSRTIRYYEELGILPEPERSPGGTRQYSTEHRFYVEGALALKELGFSLDEIKLLGQFALENPMSDLERQQATEAIRTKMQVLEHKIRVLEHLRDTLQARGHNGIDRQETRLRLTKVLQSVREGDGEALSS